MLKTLSIKNYALIDHLEIAFDDELSIISGETGAGKSILLGALGLVLGQRADSKTIRNGASKCTVEVLFDVAAYGLEPLFRQYEWEYDSECTLRREVHSTGKSRAFINDSPVGLNDLKLLGEQLIDIHSQHRNLLLNDSSFQLKVIDLLAGHTDAVSAYREQYRGYLRLKQRIKTLKEAFEQGQKEEDYIRFQYEQLKELNLREGEQKPLESELEMLTHAEEIKEALYRVDTLLSDEERGALSTLREAAGVLKNTIKVYPSIEASAGRMDGLFIDLKELLSDLASLSEGIEHNPERLSWLQSRLDALYSLEQKHRLSDSDELLQLKNEFESQLNQIESSAEDIVAAEKEMALIEKELNEQSLRLSEKRIAAARVFEKTLAESLQMLGMPNAAFRCEVARTTALEESGCDKITFLFSANKNQPLLPVADIASGGEISRLMLSIKTLIAGKTALPAIIFDEIDMGVSGEIADKMGNMMRELGRNMQVITISHLPQIAAKGKRHYLVFKEDTDTETLTRIRKLTNDERVTELARMLSGATLTDAALENARQLLALSN